MFEIGAVYFCCQQFQQKSFFAQSDPKRNICWKYWSLFSAHWWM